MATPIRLLVGLGNPGETYRLTRHNIGALWLRELAARFGVHLKADRAKRVEVGRGMLLDHDVRLLVPSTYMNLSGEAIGPYLRYFRVDPDEMLVAYDDVAFEPGKSRLKFGGGPGGHNGLKNLIQHLRGNRDFGRLRIGVGHPGSGDALVSYLTKITMPAADREQALRSGFLNDELLGWLFAGDWQRAMTKVNSQPVGEETI